MHECNAKQQIGDDSSLSLSADLTFHGRDNSVATLKRARSTHINTHNSFNTQITIVEAHYLSKERKFNVDF